MRELGNGSWPLHVSVLPLRERCLSIWPCMCKAVMGPLLQRLEAPGYVLGPDVRENEVPTSRKPKQLLLKRAASVSPHLLGIHHI